ncbi:MAG: hypothetical protein U1F48_11300 [Burkholderiales bacterium]
MSLRRACLPFLVLWLSANAAAAELGVVTLAEGAPLVMRGATWFKLVPGARVEDGDIVSLPERAQVQVESASGTIANGVGPGTLYLPPAPKGGPPLVDLQAGWLKAAAKAPGLRVRTPAFDAVVPEGVLVAHAAPASAEVFVEAGAARLVEAAANGADGAARDAKRGEYWARPAGGAFTTVGRAPKAFVAALPRGYTDALPPLAAKVKSRPVLVADHEVTFDEARPWLDGRERAAFEKRFAPRLRDPAFRKAVEPHVARYPAWDRQLHPEKFQPKEAKSP